MQLSQDLSDSLGEAFEAVRALKDAAEELFSSTGPFDQRLPTLNENGTSMSGSRLNCEGCRLLYCMT